MATPPDSMLSIPIWDTRITMDMFHQLGALTVEEKVQLLSGANFAMTHGVERLGIPPLKVCRVHSCPSGADWNSSPIVPARSGEAPFTTSCLHAAFPIRQHLQRPGTNP